MTTSVMWALKMSEVPDSMKRLFISTSLHSHFPKAWLAMIWGSAMFTNGLFTKFIDCLKTVYLFLPLSHLPPLRIWPYLRVPNHFEPALRRHLVSLAAYLQLWSKDVSLYLISLTIFCCFVAITKQKFTKAANRTAETFSLCMCDGACLCVCGPALAHVNMNFASVGVRPSSQAFVRKLVFTWKAYNHFENICYVVIQSNAGHPKRKTCHFK